MTKKFFGAMLAAALAVSGLEGARDQAVPDLRLGGGTVTQIGVVVKDVARSAEAYARILGVPTPKWELTESLEKAQTQYLGRPSPAQAKLAFIELPNIVIELIEPVGGPSTWKDVLETKGEGIHHIAFEVKDMDARLAELKAKGLSLIQKGDYPGGRYAYVDATAVLGLILELLENF